MPVPCGRKAKKMNLIVSAKIRYCVPSLSLGFSQLVRCLHVFLLSFWFPPVTAGDTWICDVKLTLGVNTCWA